MASVIKDTEPLCDVSIIKTKRVLLVENVVFENVMPCIKSFLLPRQVDAIYAEKSGFDRIGRILDFIERLTQASQYAAFNVLIKAIGGTQPELFNTLVKRYPTEAETAFCVKDIAQGVRDTIIKTGHRTDSELDETICFEYEHVELSIVDRQSGSETEHEVPHMYGNHLTRLQGTGRNISACDILSCKSKPNEKVLVFGRPGVGKSTTTQWLARQWAQGNWAHGVTLLFLLQVRVLTNVDVPITAIDLLSLYCLYQLEEMASSPVLSSWLKNPASRILIFVDGLDEIPGFAKRMINTHRISDLTQKAHPIDLVINILRGDLLPHSRMISASRPFLGLRKLCVDSKAEVLGLTSKKVTEYVERRYPEKSTHIRSVLARNHILLSVCGITFYCMMISRLLSEGVVLIDEEVQTYTRLMAFILVQYTSRKIPGSSFSLETSPYFSKLSEMAFSGIFHSKENTKLTKLVFDENDLIKFNLDKEVLTSIKKTGIVQITEKKIGHNVSVMAEFFHLSGQEMLAVLYFLSSLTCIDDTLNPMFAGGHFDMALIYTFGLNFDKTSTWINKLWTAMGSCNPGADASITSKLSASKISTRFDKLKKTLGVSNPADDTSITTQLSLFIDRLWADSKNKMKVCQLIYEAQWVDKAKEVCSYIAPNGKLSMDNVTMTAIDILAVDFMCRCAGSLSSITLNRVNADATFVKVLMSSLCEHNLDTLQELDLSRNSIGNAGAEAAMLSHNKSLQTLNIAVNSIGDAGAKAIAAMLRHNTQLQTLDISYNHIGDAGAEAMAAMLRHNKSLQTLIIADNRIGAAGAEAIAGMLIHNMSLQTLNISYNCIGAAGAEAMAAMLRHDTCLQALNIADNRIGAAGAEAIAAGLYENTTLTELDIRGKNIWPVGGKALAAVRRHRPTLTIRV